MAKYLSGNVLVEAFRLELPWNQADAPDWFQGADTSLLAEDDGLLVPTPDGARLAKWGDWIIRRFNDKFDIIDHEVFISKYKPIDESMRES